MPYGTHPDAKVRTFSDAAKFWIEKLTSKGQKTHEQTFFRQIKDKIQKENMAMNPYGAAVNQYLMRWAMLLGAWFIIEYIVRNFAAYNMMLEMLSVPMMFVTAVMLFLLMKGLRNSVLEGYISGMQCWAFGVQMMFFAGLLEALFIWLFNDFMLPDNLVRVHQARVEQYEAMIRMAEATQGEAQNTLPLMTRMTNLLQASSDQFKDMPIYTAIEAAVVMLSNTIFYGMILMVPISLILRKKPTY